MVYSCLNIRPAGLMIKSNEFQRSSHRLHRAPIILLSALVPASAFAAPATLTAATAEKMVSACLAYAQAHHGAVNVWVYDGNGEVIRFERMDGALTIASPPGTPPMPFGAAIDPNAGTPGSPGDIPVREAGETEGWIRVAGMGPGDDRACAEAAATAR
jgi:uncharacterized protein GlcG (DUF336 family)